MWELIIIHDLTLNPDTWEPSVTLSPFLLFFYFVSLKPNTVMITKKFLNHFSLDDFEEQHMVKIVEGHTWEEFKGYQICQW